MEIEVKGGPDGVTITRKGFAKEFQRMILNLTTLQYEDGLKEKIRSYAEDDRLHVVLTANSPLKVISVERIKE